jgi:hypothetical protein
MMNMNPKVVAHDAGTLLELLNLMGDPDKARDLLSSMRDQAETAAKSLEAVVAARKELEDKDRQQTALAASLESQRAELKAREDDLVAREATLAAKEADHLLRLKRLRDAVA